MRTAGKVLDAAVVVGSAVTGFTGAKLLMTGVKAKSGTVIFAGSMALLISVYAFKEAIKKINE